MLVTICMADYQYGISANGGQGKSLEMIVILHDQLVTYHTGVHFRFRPVVGNLDCFLSRGDLDRDFHYILLKLAWHEDARIQSHLNEAAVGICGAATVVSTGVATAMGCVSNRTVATAINDRNPAEIKLMISKTLPCGRRRIELVGTCSRNEQQRQKQSQQ